VNLVFDFGAVLIDWQPARLVAQHFPQLMPTAQAAAPLARAIFSHDDWHAFDRGTVTPEQVIARTAERLDLPHGQLHGLVMGIAERLLPIDETLAVLAELVHRRQQRGDVSLYFLSNMPTPYARALEQRYAFLNWFDGGIFSGDVQHCKPDARIYQMLQQRYALESAQTLFIDDLESNVEAARQLGWSGIRFTSAQQLRTDLTDLLGQ
jgi:putative hydrolase of the HAD superfamily